MSLVEAGEICMGCDDEEPRSLELCPSCCEVLCPKCWGNSDLLCCMCVFVPQRPIVTVPVREDLL